MSIPARSDVVTLRPLTSIRFFAALHIFLFHVDAGRQMMLKSDADPGLIGYPIFDQIPSWMLQFVRHGFCSTSLFFILSGFILTYLYVDSSGQMTIRWTAFLGARLSRIYPLHILLVLLLIPIQIAFQRPDPTFLLVPISANAAIVTGGLLSITLTQAWIPEFALSYNFPTWALSAIVFFYMVFPWVVRSIARLSVVTKWAVLVILPFLGLLPSLIYLALVANEPPPEFWVEFVMRTPLFWLPHFALGMLLARIFNITRYDDGWKSQAVSRLPVSWGDAAALALLLIQFLDDRSLRSWLCFDLVNPNFIIRHGLLSPLYLTLIYHLALGRGIFASLLSWKPLAFLGEASFSIFMLQLPIFILAYALAQVWPGESGSFLVLITVVLIAVAIASVRWIERPIANRLRKMIPVAPRAQS